jgi:hypothetical protein
MGHNSFDAAMDDAQFEKLISQAINHVAEAECAAIPDGYVARPSKAHERRLLKMLSDPAGYLRRKRRPKAVKILRSAAVIVLPLAVALSAAMAISHEFRSAVTGIFAPQYADTAVGSAMGLDWEIGHVTEGYELKSARGTDSASSASTAEEPMLRCAYENKSGTPIVVTIASRATEKGSDRHSYSQTMINGNRAEVYESVDAEVASIVVAYMEEIDAVVTIASFEAIEELVRMAEGIKPRQ